jgi:hypothetical protein
LDIDLSIASTEHHDLDLSFFLSDLDLSIDYSTGQLSVNGDYDVDGVPSAMPLNQTLLVQVTDKGGLTDNATVVLSFKVKYD